MVEYPEMPDPVSVVALWSSYTELVDRLVGGSRARRKGRSRPISQAPAKAATTGSEGFRDALGGAATVHGVEMAGVDLQGEGIVDVGPPPTSVRPDQVLDFSRVAKDLASQQGKPALASEFGELERKVSGYVSEDEAVGRFGEYTAAVMDLASASGLVRDVASSIDKDPEQTSPGLLDRITASLRSVGELVVNAVTTVYSKARKGLSALTEFTSSLEELIRSIPTKAVSRILDGLRAVFRYLGGLASKVISALLGWASSMKQIAKDRGFALSKFIITLPSSGWQPISVFGFSVPVPTISTPEIQIEFA